jgi:hypothetical protein
LNVDDPVEAVTPVDPGLDPGSAVIPDPDPGLNDGKRYVGTFYETVKIDD